jgi:hypothetical protein
MCGSKKTPAQWLPMYIDRYKAGTKQAIAEDDIKELQELMQYFNQKSGE